MRHIMEKRIVEAVKDLIQSVWLWRGQEEMKLTSKKINTAV